MIWVNVSQVSDRTIASQYLSGETSSPDYYVSTAPFDRLTFLERLEILDRFAKPGGLLDVGSSVGTFLEAATDRAKGIIAGYRDFDNFWDFFRKGAYMAVTGQFSCPAMYVRCPD